MLRHAAAGLLVLAAAGAAAAPDWAVTLQSDRHSDGVNLADLGADDPLARIRLREGRHLARIDDEVRVSRRDGDWTWSLLARQSASLVASRDTLALALQAGGLTPATSDQQWNTRLRYQQFAGGGIEAGRRIALADGLGASVALQALVLKHWRRRGLDGPATFEAATGTYRFDLRSQQADDRMHEPFQQPFATQGLGLLLHGALEAQRGAWQIGLAVRDLGWLHWHGLPGQDLTLSTQTRDVDADGFVVYRPLVQGRDRQDGRTRSLGGRWTARVGFAPDDRQRVDASLETQAGFGALAAFGWQRQVGAADLALRWRVHERRLTAGIAWQGLSVRYGADRLGAGAHSREFALAYAGSW